MRYQILIKNEVQIIRSRIFEMIDGIDNYEQSCEPQYHLYDELVDVKERLDLIMNLIKEEKE